MPWTAQLSKAAERDLERLPRDRQRLIAKAIDRMEEDPFLGDVQPLKGKRWRGLYRKVVGRYRIIFIPSHQERIVDIVRILLRSEKTYR